jgi:dTDP-4-dehydrorhamnose reductase
LNVAITGVTGLLGAHIAAALATHHRVVGFDRHRWWSSAKVAIHQGELADEAQRAEFIADAAPDLFVHCAAMVNVDACEERPADAYFANGVLPGLLARAVRRDCVFVYVTTDGIFSGDAPLRRETDLPCPRTVYGRSKLHGEWETALAHPEHLIVRTNFYGWSSGLKQTSGEWLYSALADRRDITLFDDFWFTPIYVTDLVERIFALLAARRRGTYHLVGGDRVTKFEFGKVLAEHAGLSLDAARRGSIDAAALRAPRPRDMSLNGELAAGLTGLAAPRCADGIKRFVADRGRTLEQRVAHLRLP